MNGERKTRTVPSSGHVCRSCKQQVDTMVERHKSMGVYVPVWTAGPCHNPHCDQYVPEPMPVNSVRSAVWKNQAGRPRR